ncbi:MAG: hypothetical protein ACREQ5_24375, partial [Candidatus Dormibacteria bacterium]
VAPGGQPAPPTHEGRVCAMTAQGPPPAEDRWRDAGGIPIFLFCQVERVDDGTEPSLLGSRPHQRGHTSAATSSAGASTRSTCAFRAIRVISVRPPCRRSSTTTQVQRQMGASQSAGPRRQEKSMPPDGTEARNLHHGQERPAQLDVLTVTVRTTRRAGQAATLADRDG